jgi:hypothetical protein
MALLTRGFSVRDPSYVLFRKPDAAWEAYVRQLYAAGQSLPLQAEAAFARSFTTRTWLVGVRSSDDSPLCCAVVDVSWSRAAPGFRILRVSRLGHGLPINAMESLCTALVELARDLRALRLHVEIFDPDPVRRIQLAQELRRVGLFDVPHGRSYQRTVLIDLRPSEAELMASFNSTCRQNIRALDKHALVCRPIVDPSLAERMNALLRETMTRTGGRFETVNWREWMAFIGRNPDLALLLGVFRADRSGGDALVAYVLGRRHGDTVEYATAASARLPDLRAPLLYAPTWQLMRWARLEGAVWFDFGGVSAGSHASGDPRGGITDFKRYFSKDIVEVGCELVFEPSSKRVFVAAQVSAAAAKARGLMLSLLSSRKSPTGADPST